MVVASNGRFFLTFAEEFHMSTDSFGTRDQLSIDGTTYHIHRLDRIKTARRLPYSLKVLLENLLRNEDGRLVTATQIQSLADWQPHATQQREIQFTPARVLMQDFKTGRPSCRDRMGQSV